MNPPIKARRPLRQGLAGGRRISTARTYRDAIADEIERLIALLDAMDGDPDLEPEDDTGADDVGEREGDCWREREAA